MKPTCRRLRREEVPIAAEVFLVSLGDLARRHGLPAPTSYTTASVMPIYEHLLETGVFEIAELEGKIVGLAAAIVRDEIWFLSMFWVLPEYKLQGIGRPLLERVQQLGKARDKAVRCVCSSIDLTAIASYLKFGMMPAGPIFTFSGAPTTPPAPPPEARISELSEEHASAIDRIVRGAAREQDHAFWRARDIPAYQLEIGERVAGYFYVKGGVIGPAAWLDPADGDALLSFAFQQASRQAEEVKLVALGSNQTAIRLATAAGLRLVSASHFLSSGVFGKLDCYVSSGPALF